MTIGTGWIAIPVVGVGGQSAGILTRLTHLAHLAHLALSIATSPLKVSLGCMAPFSHPPPAAVVHFHPGSNALLTTYYLLPTYLPLRYQYLHTYLRNPTRAPKERGKTLYTPFASPSRHCPQFA